MATEHVWECILINFESLLCNISQSLDFVLHKTCMTLSLEFSLIMKTHIMQVCIFELVFILFVSERPQDWCQRVIFCKSFQQK